MKPCLTLDSICYSYHTKSSETPVLKDISFSVNTGSFVSVVGPSGCGKSTLLSLICGLLKPESGNIILHNNNHLSDSIHIGYMLQKDSLFEWLTIYKNITLGLEMHNQCTADKLKAVDDMIETYGLSQFKSAKPSQLSGGMRQRAALIRTLALAPDILLLDEPFSALDYQTRLEVSDDIFKIITDQHKTAILVTHDISEAIAMGDEIIILSKRPATVKKVVNISFPLQNRTPLSVRTTSEFPVYFNQILKEMQS